MRVNDLTVTTLLVDLTTLFVLPFVRLIPPAVLSLF